MAHGDGESDGERSWSTDPSSDRVTRSKDRKYEHERDNGLDDESLSGQDSGTRGGQAELVVGTANRDELENPGSGQSTCRLDHDVQQRPVHACRSIHMIVTLLGKL